MQIGALTRPTAFRANRFGPEWEGNAAADDVFLKRKAHRPRKIEVRPQWPALVYPAALVLALVLPFEAIQPVIVTPWLSLSDEKLVLLLAVCAWLLLGARALPSTAEWH